MCPMVNTAKRLLKDFLPTKPKQTNTQKQTNKERQTAERKKAKNVQGCSRSIVQCTQLLKGIKTSLVMGEGCKLRKKKQFPFNFLVIETPYLKARLYVKGQRSSPMFL